METGKGRERKYKEKEGGKRGQGEEGGRRVSSATFPSCVGMVMALRAVVCPLRWHLARQGH